MTAVLLALAFGAALTYAGVSGATRDRYIAQYVSERHEQWRDCYSTGGWA